MVHIHLGYIQISNITPQEMSRMFGGFCEQVLNKKHLRDQWMPYRFLV